MVAIIPARSGSKGLKNKNILPYKGKPLLTHAVEIGVKSPLVSKGFISTDSTQYERIAIDAGACSLGLRPDVLAGDSAKTIDVVCDVLDQLEKKEEVYEYVLLLQPTSPERTVEQIQEMYNLLNTSADIYAVVSVTRFEEPHPYKLKLVTDDGKLNNFLPEGNSEVPRQEMPAVYKLTGAYYLSRVVSLRKNRSFLPVGRTAAYITDDCVNIDTQGDYDFLQWKSGQVR